MFILYLKEMAKELGYSDMKVFNQNFSNGSLEEGRLYITLDDVAFEMIFDIPENGKFMCIVNVCIQSTN